MLTILRFEIHQTVIAFEHSAFNLLNGKRCRYFDWREKKTTLIPQTWVWKLAAI
ncbi:Uncharacterised protein [Vibrio cholerae]|nr:Uncharacterised protein [Vibrio cholerae]